MASEHQDPTRDERRAIAPYNFVSLPGRLVLFRDQPDSLLRVDQSQYHEDRLTGWIDLNIETKSPLYVRGPLDPGQYRRMEQQENDASERTPHLEKERNRPNFFHHGDQDRPVIPGSSLRGMMRTLVEILGHGKFGPVSERPLVYRAVADMSAHGDAYRAMLFEEERGRAKYYTPRFRAGYIRHRGGDWYIQPAQEINDTTYARISHRKLSVLSEHLKPAGKLKNSSVIYIEPGPYEFQEIRGGFIHIRYARAVRAAATPGAGLIEATLAASGPMFSKRSEAVVFPPDPARDGTDHWIRIPDGTAQSQQDPAEKEPDLLGAYKDQITPEQQKLLGNDGVLQDGRPVFYLMKGDDLHFFGHTQMFRLPYARAPRDMLARSHRSEDTLDLAEAIFGRARRSGEEMAGRVFVGDATLEEGQSGYWLSSEEGIIPRILSGPKPTTFQHYLTQSRPDNEKGKGLHTYNAPPGTTTLRGYKLYWHQGDTELQQFQETLSPKERQQDKVHTRIRPVRSGTRFQGRLYFENLLPVEFGLLWWALALPGAEGDHFHKLGMGKPYGLGAIAIHPSVHFVAPARRYIQLLEDTARGWQWTTGVLPAEERDTIATTAVADFEKLVTDTVQGERFASLPRVQELLALLSWPGPEPHEEHSRYMEIERADPHAKKGKHNEYRERPVLPTPGNVLATASRRAGTRQSTRPRTVSSATTDLTRGASPQQSGRVKVWKGSYGFITPDGGGRDVFVHQSRLPRGITDLQPGQRVRYTYEQGQKGPQVLMLTVE